MEPPPLSGGCQCGAVRYRIIGALGDAAICHCRMCQKAFGSWGAALVTVAARHLEWTRGEPSVFRSSSVVARGFCRNCGTPLFMREDGDPNYDLAIGTLDDPDAIPSLSRQCGVESRLHWFLAMTDLPEERTVDARSQDDLRKLASLQHPDHDTADWPPLTARPARP